MPGFLSPHKLQGALVGTECRVPQHIGLPAFLQGLPHLCHPSRTRSRYTLPGIPAWRAPGKPAPSHHSKHLSLDFPRGGPHPRHPGRRMPCASSQFSVEPGWHRVWAALGEGSLRYLGACLMCEESWEVWCQVTLRTELPCDLPSFRV